MTLAELNGGSPNGRHTEPRLQTGQTASDSLVDLFSYRYNHPRGNVSLALRFGEALQFGSIEGSGMILSVGISGEKSIVPERKYESELKARGLRIVRVNQVGGRLPIPDKSAVAIIGNVLSGPRLPLEIQEMIRVLAFEAPVFLNAYKGLNQNGEFDDEVLLERYLAELNVYGTTREGPPHQRWWEINASTLPKIMPPLREQPIPKVYGGEDYDESTHQIVWSQEESRF